MAQRSGMRRAKVSIARPLAVMLRGTWRHGTEFRWSKKAAMA